MSTIYCIFLIMVQIKMNDSHFIMAQEFLSYPDKTWVTTDFFYLNRPAVVKFFTSLIKEDVMKRKSAFGPASRALVIHPEKLLELCIRGFKKSESKVLNFISKESSANLIKELKDHNIEFFLGRFSGVKPKLVYSTDSHLSLLLPDPGIFQGKKLDFFQMDLGFYKVKFGGNINIILPRYKKFLRRHVQKIKNVLIPSDFYSYLYLAASQTPMAKPQAEFMEAKLKGVYGNFLAWK